MLFVSIKSFSQDCPCVNAAVIGIDTKNSVIHNNKIAIMDDVTIKLGESINLYTKQNTGKITWYKDGQLVDNTLVMPTETTVYTAKSTLHGCPDAVATVQIRIQKNSAGDMDNDVSISPNPTNDNLRISSSNKAIKSIKITSLLGGNIKMLRFGSLLKQQSINISSLVAGVYTLTIEMEGNIIINKKIIKN